VEFDSSSDLDSPPSAPDASSADAGLDAARADAATDATVPVDAGRDAQAVADATTPLDASDGAAPPDAGDSSVAIDASDAAPAADAADAASAEGGEDGGEDAGEDAASPDAALDASICPPGGCLASCAAILAQDAGAPDGTYFIDPGTGPVAVACLMSVNGGGWTPLVPPVASALDTVTSKVYLYVYGAAWYEAPASTLAWSWSSGQQLTGTYSYFTGTTGSSFVCTGSSEVPAFGVGCSDGPGGTFKTLPYYSDDPAAGQCEVCQDQPNAFGTGSCASGVSVYVR
jgi:hypothetical protein